MAVFGEAGVTRRIVNEKGRPEPPLSAR